MNSLVLACLLTAAVFMTVERLLPARPLAHVESWWIRVIVINAVQAAIVIIGGFVWDPFFSRIHVVDFMSELSPFAGGVVGYFVLTFVYYWWHRWRHQVPILWKWLHQLHHTPSRIETITSFYKHPFEILTNTVLTSVVCYILLGLSPLQTTWTIYFLAVAEYCYHVNVRTPHLLGYFIQRPEMHRVHHQRGLHRYNYSDLPVWDMLFGTYNNPVDQPLECGLGEQTERQLVRLLKGEVFEDTGR